MKILHTADWHLGKRLNNFSRLEEQADVLDEICRIADSESVDAVLIAGDLFDTFNPPTEAIDLFYKTLKKLADNGRRAVIAIAGNHDSPDRIEAPDPLARECGILFMGYPTSRMQKFKLESGLAVTQSEPGFLEISVPGCDHPLRLLSTPYANEYRLKQFLGTDNQEEEMRKLLETQWRELAEKYCDAEGVNVLVSHLFMVKKGEKLPDEPEDEKPILHVGGAQAVYTANIPEQIKYCALGHLHGYRVMDTNPCPAVYSSSPLSYSFSEAEQEKYVVVIEVTPGNKAEFKPIPLQQGKTLYKKRFEDVDEAVAWLQDHQDALVELTIVTDNYLTSYERKRLNNAHDGIVTIIPEVKYVKAQTPLVKSIDLNVDMEELFKQYFQYTHGQKPNKEILSLFKEIRGHEVEE
jgi:DNA repair protein SbcD/Mre11